MEYNLINSIAESAKIPQKAEKIMWKNLRRGGLPQKRHSL